MAIFGSQIMLIYDQMYEPEAIHKQVTVVRQQRESFTTGFSSSESLGSQSWNANESHRADSKRTQ